jgi:hypothetical protein
MCYRIQNVPNPRRIINHDELSTLQNGWDTLNASDTWVAIFMGIITIEQTLKFDCYGSRNLGNGRSHITFFPPHSYHNKYTGSQGEKRLSLPGGGLFLRHSLSLYSLVFLRVYFVH